MKTEMLMPQMGESITEATILNWLKGVGDKVEKDETILEISTDKVDSEIPAPASGVIVEIKAKEGDTVDVQSVIAIIDSEAEAGGVVAKEEIKEETKKEDLSAKQITTSSASNDGVVTEQKKLEKKERESKVNDGVTLDEERNLKAKTQVTSTPVNTSENLPSKSHEIPSRQGSRVYSPVVRSIAAQHGLSPNELLLVNGSGEHGRVTKEDLLSYLQSRDPSAAVSNISAKPTQKKDAPISNSINYGTDGVFVEEMDRMRKIIAKHMVDSKATSPHVYTVAEVDVTNIAKWRSAKQNEFVKRYGFKLSFTPFFLEAASKALATYPQVNASVEGDKIIYKRDVNLGCAVALGTTGLIVPVIRKADQLNLSGLADSLQDIALRARSKKLKPEDIQGGTFTVTNPGTFGSILGYPIINQPQLGILGVGAIKKRPMVVNDAIAIRDIVYITLSYDHRVIDGSLGGTFLNFIAKYLENWDMSRDVF